jgi:excisionase family DNA binding protein
MSKHTPIYPIGDFLTYAEAASKLGISTRTLMRWIDAGRLPVVTFSERIKRIRVADLRDLIHTCSGH